MTTLPTREQVDAAAPLDFSQTRGEKQCTIQVEIAPDGLHVRAEWTAGLSTIPGVIERLMALGVVELVSASRPAPAAKPKVETVEPLYKPDETACCPVHKRALSEGAYALYCSARAKPGEATTARTIARYVLLSNNATHRASLVEVTSGASQRRDYGEQRTSRTDSTRG